MLLPKFNLQVWGYFILFAINIGARRIKTSSRIPTEELDPGFWIRTGEEELFSTLNQQQIKTEAKNVILFLGDGMSLSTITAARMYKGQLKGKSGEEEKLSFEQFPNVGLAKTYNVDHQIPDSAATATAFLCGVKTNFGTVGLDPRAKRADCSKSIGRNVTCILELFQRKGKSTGFVTTARVSHATPAPLYSWSPDRLWESDSDLTMEAQDHGCTDIASQLVHDGPGNNINVIFGGGRGNLLPRHQHDPEYTDKMGRRNDGRNLINEWLNDKHRKGRSAEYAWNQEQFEDIPDRVDHAIGIFEYSHMHFSGFREKDVAGEPTLADMTEKAIKILSKNTQGYFLLVEGARIDHAHHANGARVALEETLAMEEAITRATGMVDKENTLLVVTSDHSHPLNIGSFSTRGNNILGLGDYSDDKSKADISDADKLPYTTLSYANGPGYNPHHPRSDLTHNNTESRHYRQTSAVPLTEATHEGSDVPIYARGPWAHLFHSTHEQHYIFHAIAYASCTSATSRNAEHCLQTPVSYRSSRLAEPPLTSSSSSFTYSNSAVTFVYSNPFQNVCILQSVFLVIISGFLNSL